MYRERYVYYLSRLPDRIFTESAKLLYNLRVDIVGDFRRFEVGQEN